MLADLDDSVDPDTVSWADMAWFCLTREEQLNDRERDFIKNMVFRTGRAREPSDAQARWLDGIFEKLKTGEKYSARRRTHRTCAG